MSFLFAVSVVAMCYLPLIAILAYIKKDPSIANITWIGGVWLLTVFTLVRYHLYLTRQIIVTALLTLWAVRLILYWIIRYDGKDPRFSSWRQKEAGDALSFILFYVFGVQAPLMFLMTIPGFLLTRMCAPGFTLFDTIGFWIWIVGFLYETISDFHLFFFLRKPENAGKVLSKGLWHFSRHPNYFGEIVMWIGLSIMALSVPFGYYAFIAPIAITVWLAFIGGIPWVEGVMASLPEYQQYQRTTNALIPWLPKKGE